MTKEEKARQKLAIVHENNRRLAQSILDRAAQLDDIFERRLHPVRYQLRKLLRALRFTQGELMKCLAVILVIAVSAFFNSAHAVRIPMYLSYNPSTIDYFYTTDSAQHNSAIAHLGYQNQGIAFYVEGAYITNTRLIGRYWRGGSYSDHFYTNSAADRSYVTNNGWSFQQYEGHMYPVDALSRDPASVRLYRLFWANWGTNNYAHFYTTNWSQVQHYQSIGWQYDGVVGYVWTTPSGKQWDSSFVRQTVPTSMEYDVPTAVSITMRNTGWDRWRVGHWFLATHDPQDNKFWCVQNVADPSRVPIPHDVWPGGDVTFNFVVKPGLCTTPLFYAQFTWIMLGSYGTHGVSTPGVAVSISTTATPVGPIIVPLNVEPGSRVFTQVTMKNTGTQTWTRAGGYRLGSQAPQDNWTWGLARVDLPTDVSVAPGQQHIFAFEATAPATVGPYTMQWRMVQEGVRWMGTATELKSITVTNTIERGKLPPGLPPTFTPSWTPPPGNPFGFNCC